jgi:hypothetical protein
MMTWCHLGEEEEMECNPMELKTKVSIGFVFSDQDIIEGVITLRIDSRTIKREISRAIDHLSAIR